MPDSVFEAAVAGVLYHEGGFTNGEHDPGNWTGGKCGEGECRGTNYGISAATYPGLDIKGLTREKAKAIYFSDYWLKYRINRLPGVSLPAKTLDTAVNIGPERAIRMLQRSIAAAGVPCLVDGIIGPTTIAACAKVDLLKVVTAYRAALRQYYVDLVDEKPSLSRFMAGWLSRAAS